MYQNNRQHGFSHVLLPAFIVLVIGLIGAYVVSSSHASPNISGNSSVQHTPAGSRERIIKIAQHHSHIHELPLGSNVTNLWSTKHAPVSEAWCAVYVSWVWHASGVRLNGQPYPEQPAVSQIRDTAVAGHRFKSNSSRPEKGDAIIYGRDGGGEDAHVGVIISVRGQTITVVEGNAGSNDDRTIRRRLNLSKLHDQDYLNRYVPHQYVYGYASPPPRN